jgi:hypothetical protein
MLEELLRYGFIEKSNDYSIGKLFKFIWSADSRDEQVHIKLCEVLRNNDPMKRQSQGYLQDLEILRDEIPDDLLDDFDFLDNDTLEMIFGAFPTHLFSFQTDLTFYTDHFVRISEFLSVNRSLQQLTMRRIVGNVEAQQIAKALMKNTTLRSLDVSRNSINFMGAKAIADMLLVNTSLEKLNVSYNPLAEAGFNLITSALFINQSITQINLERTVDYMRSFTRLGSAIEFNTALKRLNLDINPWNLDTSGTFALLNFTSSNIETLSFRYCHFSPEMLQNFATGLKSLHQLTKLDVSHNDLSTDAFKHLVQVLIVMPKLEILDLGLTRLGVQYDEVQVDLLRLLSEAPVLSSLSLLGLFRPMTTSSLLEAIALRSIQFLTLSIPIGEDQDWVSLFQLISSPSTQLRWLDLSVFQFEALTASLLCNALKKNKVLAYLSIACSEISGDWKDALLSVFKENRTLCFLEISVKGQVQSLDSNGDELIARNLAWCTAQAKMTLCGLFSKSPSKHLDAFNLTRMIWQFASNWHIAHISPLIEFKKILT